jgi:prepilin peptidase CpaA
MFSGSMTGMAWGAAFTLLLVTGCATDLRWRRIPNPLVLVILAGGLLFSASSGPILPSLARSLAGVTAGFGIWIVFYIGGVMGAGDVKFFAAAGAWLGPGTTWRAALIAAVAGGVLAVVVLVRERRLGSTMRRMALAASTRSLELLSGASEVEARSRRPLPYGVALAVGAGLAAWFPK